MSGPRVGVLGGTFDPVHLGHLIAAEEARAGLLLDQVVFVPARIPPHKLGRPTTSAEHRVAMLDLALALDRSFRVSRVDLDRPGPHYTVDMLALLRSGDEIGPNASLWFIMGSDSLADLPTWRDPPGILDQTRLCVVDRPGYAPELDALESAIPGLADRVDRVTMPLIGISGTDIRRRVAVGGTIAYQVPDAVRAYIERHGLYADRAGASHGGEER